MRYTAGRLSIGKGRVTGAATIEIVGPQSTLTRRVAEVLEQHRRTGAALSGGGTVARRRPAGGDASRVRSERPADADRPEYAAVEIEVPPKASRTYVVNALKPDGSTAPAEVREQVRAVREREPHAPVFVLLDEANAEAVRAARRAGATDFFGAAAASNPAALEWRVIARLQRQGILRRVEVESKTSPRRKTARSAPGLHVRLGEPVEPTAREVAKALARVEAGLKRRPTPKLTLARAAKLTTVAAPELRNERSGRLDAKRIAERLGVSVNRLAPATGVSQQALSKRPDSPRAQKGLASIARVIVALNELNPAGEAKMWLNTPHRGLGDAAPLDLILRSRADVVARMLEAALEGIPG